MLYSSSGAKYLPLGRLEGVLEAGQVVGVRDAHDVPAVGDEARGNILGESPVGVALNGDLVVVPDPDEVVELEVSGEGGGLGGNTILHAAVAAEGVGVEVEELLSGLVVGGAEPPAGNGHVHRDGEAVPEGPRGGLDPGSPILASAGGGREGPALDKLDGPFWKASPNRRKLLCVLCACIHCS